MERNKVRNFANSKATAAITLDWYFNDSPAVLGLKSNFGTLRNYLELGINPAKTSMYIDPEDDWTDERLASVRRHKIIRRALGLCTIQSQKILEQYYTYRQWPPQLRAYFDDLTGLAVLSAGLDTLITWIMNQKKHKAQATKLRSHCRRVLESATAEFVNAFKIEKEQYE